MTKQKYYVVWKGLKPGVYDNWAICEKQIKGFEGAIFKSFLTKTQAEKAFKDDFKNYINREFRSLDKASSKLISSVGKPILESIAVDAACSGNPGVMEYRGVYTKTGEEIFHQGTFKQGTNNIGEFLALVHGLAYLKQKNLDLPVYSDSVSALSWVRNKKTKTTLVQTEKNKELFQLLERAIKWLNENKYKTKIIKWDTENWGEIPADFGRK